MKALLLVVVIAVGAWWYLIGGQKLSEADVRGFYRDYEAAMLERKPDALCALLAEKFESTGVVMSGGASRSTSQTRGQACDSYRDMYAVWDTLGEKMGGTLQLDSDYKIIDLQIAPDARSATVEITSSLDVAGSVMNLKSHTRDTLIKKNGKVLILKSEGTGSVGVGNPSSRQVVRLVTTSLANALSATPSTVLAARSTTRPAA